MILAMTTILALVAAAFFFWLWRMEHHVAMKDLHTIDGEVERNIEAHRSGIRIGRLTAQLDEKAGNSVTYMSDHRRPMSVIEAGKGDAA